MFQPNNNNKNTHLLKPNQSSVQINHSSKSITRVAIKQLGNMSQETKDIQDCCRVWQYKKPNRSNKEFRNHDDLRSMVYNYCYCIYLADKSVSPQCKFEMAGCEVDFKKMIEKNGYEIYAIRRVDDSHIRLREDNSDRISHLEIL